MSKSQNNIGSDVEKKSFIRRPFIGSFVPNDLRNDLPLWRMYGKENKEDAKGCAITLDREKLIDILKAKLITDGKNITTEEIEEEFRFYHVIYRKNDNEFNFEIPGSDTKTSDLNHFMENLQGDISKFNIHAEKEKYIQEVKSLLERISYLFKTAVYEHEQELRLVVSGSGFTKNIDSDETIPRVYIELVDITPAITDITLGPKVERVDEWVAAYYYSLEKDCLQPDIFISHLPFK